MKSPDQEARDLSRILLDAAWQDPDHMVPVATLRALRIVPSKISKFPLDEAARWLGIDPRILEQESTRFVRVQRLNTAAAPVVAVVAVVAAATPPLVVADRAVGSR